MRGGLEVVWVKDRRILTGIRDSKYNSAIDGIPITTNKVVLIRTPTYLLPYENTGKYGKAELFEPNTQHITLRAALALSSPKDEVGNMVGLVCFNGALLVIRS